MPRGKSFRRCEAARRRIQAAQVQRIGFPNTSSDFVPLRGSGQRHKVNEWPRSEHTGLQHKLVIPDGSLDKKFVLIIGDSHLRTFADDIVQMPGGSMAFGFLSIPGACADKLRQEVVHVVLPRDPDAICIIGPSNNLTASINPEEAGKEFQDYLLTVSCRWPKVFCTGMVPRLTESREKQERLQQEFHRRAAKFGIPFFSTAEYFPLDHDRVHLSDDHRSQILKDLMWTAAYEFFELSASKPLML